MPVNLDQLLNNGLDNTYTEFAETLKESTKAAITQTPLASGFEFEGAKYFDGKVQKIYHNGSWQDNIDFSKVNYTDVIGAPIISSDVNETNLNAVPVLEVVQKYADETIYHYRPAENDNKSFSWNTRQEFSLGRDFSTDGKYGKINDLNQTIYMPNNGSKIVLKGVAMISPGLANSRVLITYRKSIPAGYVMDCGGITLTKVCVSKACDTQFSIASDAGAPSSSSGFFMYIHDPDKSHSGWTSNPEYGYNDHEYRVFWSVTFVNISKLNR